MIRRWLAPVCCALVAMGLVATCASGGSRLNGGDDDDGGPVHDAPKQLDASPLLVDAAPQPIDAKLPDAAVLPPDAPPDAPVSSLFCTSNNMCTNAGECCLTLGGPQGFCAPGVVIAGVCFPQ
ncbi:MAG: hypothetical protein KF773_20140 [Deltaproteobacteria bacterium]|nr:hypothetical protein [Deltaproteobacteria bacterium]MCW5805923.1 hypothetical protein [Deltaproteobacteria bacterium]